MPHYAQVILPLALNGTFTYAIPDEMVPQVCVGSRVIVQFGARRYYTGIVAALSPTPPDGVEHIKAIDDCPDPQPIVFPQQLEAWQWLSQYYMCTLGEVMNAALPAGLKIESETQFSLTTDFAANDENLPSLTDTERRIIGALITDERKHTLASIEKALHAKSLLRPLRHLIQLGAVQVKENQVTHFHPRKERYVRLAPPFFDEPRLHALLDSLQKAPAQLQALQHYLQASHAADAISQHSHALLHEVKLSALHQADSRFAAAITALRKKDVLTTYDQVRSRLQSACAADGTPVAPHPLNPMQQAAFEEIGRIFTAKEVCLLHGVTSSGKTEVYAHLIAQCIAQGQQVLFLVPEIALTTQLTTRLARVFGSRMGVYHSKFLDAERVELWQKQCSTAPYDLILGVRSSVFLPMPRLGLIIVDEEHEPSYKQQDPAPRYHARDFAIMLAHKVGAKVLLGSATPSVESYYNAQSGKYGLVTMTKRYADQPLPTIVVEDVAELRRKKQMKTPFSPRLLTEVRQALADGKQAILFQNRRGYAPVLHCNACGWTPHCTKCDVPLTFHQSIQRLVCHYCGTAYTIPPQCPACHHTDLRDMGYGTEKIESLAQAAFPEANTLRMDLDTTRSRSAYDDLIEQFQTRQANLLIGTQMVTKGLDFSHVQVVGILNADQLLSLPDFRAHERTFQMLSQVAGRAGRREGQGLVVLQTRQPDLPVIQQIVRSDYAAMYADQLDQRQHYHYPPFARLITIYLKHRDDATVEHAAQHYAALIRPYFADHLLGPDRPLIARVQLRFIRKMMIKVPQGRSATEVRRVLYQALQMLQSYNVYKSVTVQFDVDPYN